MDLINLNITPIIYSSENEELENIQLLNNKNLYFQSLNLNSNNIYVLFTKLTERYQ